MHQHRVHLLVVGDKFWKKLRDTCVPGKVKICVWRVCLDALPTRSNLCKRCVMIEDLCVVFGGQVEFVEHVLLDCTLARAVWFQIMGLRVEIDHGLFLVQWISRLSVQLQRPRFEFCLILICALWSNVTKCFAMVGCFRRKRL